MSSEKQMLRALPSIDRLLREERVLALCEEYGRSATKRMLQVILKERRVAIRSGEIQLAADEDCIIEAETRMRAERPMTLRSVINATGVILHTNLGRAPICLAARRAVAAIGRDYCSLEYDLRIGGRGSRYQHAMHQLKTLTGAEDALVVNNNAAALFLLLSTLAKDREVVISRGQLVEIGGGFRIPEILRASGAILREVGSTNRTRISDYAGAIGEQTALLLRVHLANFRMLGFTEATSLADMINLGVTNDIPIIDDVGSGALLDTTSLGLPAEPMVQKSIAAGADVVLFSGDKLLGGPQAGILVGKAAILSQLRRHPLARALRADKLALAALIPTLDAYLNGCALEEIPSWWMMARRVGELREVAARWQVELGGELVETRSTIGGGSLPGATLPTVALALESKSVERCLALLREAAPPIIGRIEEGCLLLDPRTVLPDQEEQLLLGLRATLLA